MKDEIQEIVDGVSKSLEPMVKKAISDHLKDYDSMNNLPEVMSLLEANRQTGIAVSTLKKKARDGEIELIRTSDGRGKLRIKKSELIKAMTRK